MSEEKLKILQMVQEGKINATEGLELLKALEESESKVEAPGFTSSRFANRFLRIKVSSSGTLKVNVNVPLSLLRVVSKFATLGMGYIPETARQEMKEKGVDLADLDIEELMRMFEQGMLEGGKLVEVEVNDPVEGLVKVEIYVE